MVRRRSTVRFRKGALNRLRWAGPVATLGLVFAVVAARALLRTIHFESTSEAVYTAWVYNPIVAGFALPALLAWMCSGVLLFSRWSTRTRVVIITVVGLAAVVGPVLGLHEYDARRHIGTTLTRAVSALPTPAGGTELPRPPLVDNSETFGDLPEPQAQRLWRLPGRSRADVCSAIQDEYAAGGGWQPVPGECGVIRNYDRYYVEVTPTLDPAGPNEWVILAVAAPRDS